MEGLLETRGELCGTCDELRGLSKFWYELPFPSPRVPVLHTGHSSNQSLFKEPHSVQYQVSAGCVAMVKHA